MYFYKLISIISFHTLTPQNTFQSKSTTFLFEKAESKKNFSSKFYSDRIPRLWNKLSKRNPRASFYPLAFIRILISLKLNCSHDQYINIQQKLLLIPTTIVGLLCQLTCACPRCHPLFLSLSVSLSTSFVPTRSAYLDYILFNLHVAVCDNDNVVTDKVKLINK